ncbi:MAG TPA: hypothetical protein VML19_30680, partial [Verrucomicrobiae bacterium]|nr:hypothetical protein [Verrucomicrobiae bacterium]
MSHVHHNARQMRFAENLTGPEPAGSRDPTGPCENVSNTGGCLGIAGRKRRVDGVRDFQPGKAFCPFFKEGRGVPGKATGVTADLSAAAGP